MGRARLSAALERLPQTFAHFDSQRRNLMIRARSDGEDELVAVDWARCGLRPVGAQFDEAAFPAYLAGLRAAGWTGSVDDGTAPARLARLPAAALRWRRHSAARPQPIAHSHARPAARMGRLAAGGVVVRYITGSHNNILVQPHVRSLATALRASLDGCQGAPPLPLQ